MRRIEDPAGPAVAPTILIVDDEPHILRILSFKLRREGFATAEARTAAEAEEWLADHAADLILLDVGLEAANAGFELGRRLRAHSATRATPIIVLTAHGLAEDVLAGREIGAVGYVTKPFSTADLIGRIQALVGG